jgi:hypothetical protein
MNKAAAAVFGVVAAWTVDGVRTPNALAHHCSITSGSCSCSPPDGKYCETAVGGDPDYCNGSTCVSPCTKLYNGPPHFFEWAYPESTGGCWCTLDCCSGGNRGHWKCCDCTCPGPLYCACRSFVITQVNDPTCPTLPSLKPEPDVSKR